MKRQLLLLSVAVLYALPAYAADAAPPSDMMAAEIAHEQQVQAQLNQLQQQRDAAFLKQLEAETLIEEQRMLAAQGGTPQTTGTPAP